MTDAIPEATANAITELVRETVRSEMGSLLKSIGGKDTPVGHGYGVQKALLFGQYETKRVRQIMDEVLEARGKPSVVRGTELDESIRKSRSCFVNPFADDFMAQDDRLLMQSVFLRLVGLCHITRGTRLKYLPELSSVPNEQLQFVEYAEGGYYHFHSDSHTTRKENRFVSTSLMVDPAEEGGVFEFRDEAMAPELAEAVNCVGTAVVFPSHAYHRVTPVEKGRRLSITLWCSSRTPEK